MVSVGLTRRSWTSNSLHGRVPLDLRINSIWSLLILRLRRIPRIRGLEAHQRCSYRGQDGQGERDAAAAAINLFHDETMHWTIRIEDDPEVKRANQQLDWAIVSASKRAKASGTGGEVDTPGPRIRRRGSRRPICA